MKHPIYSIWFDVGGTLQVSHKNTEERRAAISKLHALLSYQGSVDELNQLLHTRQSEYRSWCIRTEYEVSEAVLWTKYLLPDYPTAFVAQNAHAFNALWRGGRDRVLVPGAVETLQTLVARGYRLFVISNTTSSSETPQMLAKNGLSDVFEGVILSTTFGRRKPHPALFYHAAQQVGINTEFCAYVGNDPTRDLVGARQAGLGAAILVDHTCGSNEDPDDDTTQHEGTCMQPDALINSLPQLLEIFPPINGKIVPKWKKQPLYDAALSTMWGVDQPGSFNQTFVDGQQVGFARFELNHKVSTELFEEYDHNLFYIASIHEPCPTTISYAERKSADIAVSSLDEVCRVKAVDDIKRSIDLAAKLGSRLVVIHPGTIVCEKSRDDQLRVLFELGRQSSSEYQTLLAEVLSDRKALVKPHLDRVQKSLQEIIRFSIGSGISLGLENRYRYYDIPLPDEMAALLALCDADWFGFLYDVGHAHTLDVLGQVPHFEWLDRFSSRMVGVHLHDVIGITDHQVPGKGEVDFSAIAPYIPDSALRTLEITPQASLEDLAKGLEVLADHGCIERISPQ